MAAKTTAKKIYHELKVLHPDRASRVKEMIDGNVWWDRIENIEMLEPTTNFVYDLQVDETENFMIANGIFTHNSFLGNHRPNLLFSEDIIPHGLPPCGIPGDRIRIIAPSYHFLFVAAALGSIFSGIREPAFGSLFADSTNPDNRALSYALWNVVPRARSWGACCSSLPEGAREARGIGSKR